MMTMAMMRGVVSNLINIDMEVMNMMRNMNITVLMVVMKAMVMMMVLEVESNLISIEMEVTNMIR